MSIEAAIYSLISGDPTIAALVVDRVYPVFVPSGTIGAAVTYQTVDGDDEYTCEGPVGLPEDRVQITAWSAEAKDGGTHVQMLALFAALKDLFDGYVGSAGGVTIAGCYIVDKDDVLSGDKEGSDYRWGKRMDVMVAYEE